MHPGAPQTAAVYPLVPTRSFDDALTYGVPDELAPTLAVGSLVEIPVGPALRVGVVAALGVSVAPTIKLRPISRALDGPTVPPALVQLAEWVADQYGCARTRALAMVVPPRLSAHARASNVPTRRRQQAVRLAPDPPTNGGAPELTKRQAAIAERLPSSWVSVAELAGVLSTTRASLQKLADLGIAELEERYVEELAPATDIALDVSDTPEQLPEPRVIELTPAQLAAVDVCAQGSPDDPATVLMGITGSGKTEVYLELIARTLDAGRDAIVLVPEIALTPQTARRFVERFPGGVEVLHSNLTKAQRADAWDRIASGEARVVVGPRSAVFAPVRALGVLVIDEEHDGSYKQDSEPRYDARRVAWRRAMLERALVVYGSATPRAETWHGVRRRAMLRERAAGGQLAPVTLVDLRVEGDGFPITAPVQAALDATLRRGRKAIVLHNRRGYATSLHCRTCGGGFRCASCDVSLVIHGTKAREQQLACHHCGFRAPVPGQCPTCGAADIARLGAGTERLERDLQQQFGVEVFRLDADASRTRGGVATILQGFADAGPSILTGTQMVAKGHDFPDVELAVVVDADTALAIPDFRAQERAFSLVAQLAGRAGRSTQTAEHARVLVQSWDTEQEFLRFALSHDVEGFLETELQRRAELRYPPFSRLVRVLLSASVERNLEPWCNAVLDGMRTLDVGQVLGPAPLMRIADRHRAQVLLKTNNALAVATAMRGFLRTTEADRTRVDVRIALDVDPQSLI